MKPYSIVLEVGSAIGHLISAGFALDAIDNAQSNPEWAAVEAIVALYIQASKYLERKNRSALQKISQRYDDENPHPEKSVKRPDLLLNRYLVFYKRNDINSPKAVRGSIHPTDRLSLEEVCSHPMDVVYTI